jgi:endonuclease-3
MEKCGTKQKDAKRIFPEELWNDLHLQIIWYGREYSSSWLDLDQDIITKTVGRKLSSTTT